MTPPERSYISVISTFVLLIVAMLLLESCSADFKRRVILTYPSSFSRPEPSASAPVQVGVARFVDVRGMADVVGGIYKKYAEPRPVWIVVNDLGTFLRDALISELLDAGIAATLDDRAREYRVEGKINIFYGWATSTSLYFTASVNVDISLFDRAHLIFAQSYLAEKTSSIAEVEAFPFFGRDVFGKPKSSETDTNCASLFSAAAAEAMKKAAKDIRDYLAKEAEHGKL